MATYILLATFTEQGIRNVRETTKRADVFRELAKTFGASVKDIYWTLGRYDIICTIEATDDVSATALGLTLGESGNVRIETLRAFSYDDMGAILAKVV